MLRILLGTTPTRLRLAGGGAVSAALHGSAIVLIALSAGEPGPVVQRNHEVTEERVTFMSTALAPRLTRRGDAKESSGRSTRATVKRMKDAPAPMEAIALQQAIDAVLVASAEAPAPTPDLDAMMRDWLAKPDSLSGTSDGVGAVVLAMTGMQAPSDGIYTESMVDRIVEARRSNPTPRYPDALRERGVEGSFLVQFVVDTTGKVLDEGMEFPSSMHELFMNSVRSALKRSRYYPARIAGRLVRQRVMQEFRFTLLRR